MGWEKYYFICLALLRSSHGNFQTNWCRPHPVRGKKTAPRTLFLLFASYNCFPITLYTVKKDREFPVPSRDVTTKLSLGGNNDVRNKLFLPRGSLVSDIPAGDGKLVYLFLRSSVGLRHTFHIIQLIETTVLNILPDIWDDGENRLTIINLFK